MPEKRRRTIAFDESNAPEPTSPGRHRSDTGPESGGQSGDLQQLSDITESSSESVEELVSAGQDVEAGELAGVQDAADHPEQEVRVRQDRRKPAFPPKSL